MRDPIVILGGMGPQASLRFHELLIQKSTAYHGGGNDDFPYIVHLSLPVKDFISSETAKNEAAALLNQLGGILTKLDPAVVALACNTAHILQAEVAILQQPAFVSMPKTVAAKLTSKGIRNAGLLASSTTIRTGLYKSALAENDVRVTLPKAQELAAVEEAIRSVIAGSIDKQLQAKLSRIAYSLTASGAEAVVLGCTELPLLFDSNSVNIPVFDCLDIYADAVIEQYYLYNGA